MDPVGSSQGSRKQRRRSVSPSKTRKKSCEACRRSKARCNEVLPACSRCDRKGIECRYKGTRNEDKTLPATELPNMSSYDADWCTKNAITFQESPVFVDGIADLDIPFVGFESEFAAHIESAGYTTGTSNGSSNGDALSYQISTSSVPSNDSPEESGQMPIDPALATSETQTQGAEPPLLPFQFVTVYQDDGTKAIEIYSRENAEGYNSRYFGFDKVRVINASACVNRVLGTFQMWPHRMIKAINLPPFIHPHHPSMLVSGANAVGQLDRTSVRRSYPKLPEALANCQSICTMFFNKTEENKAFVWRSIKREQERIYGNFKQWPIRDRLSGYQAMLLYALLRIIDGEHEHNDFDMAFVLTVTEINAGLWNNDLRDIQFRQQGPEHISFEDWLLAESVCRSGLVFSCMFIILELYKAMPPTPGCGGIDAIPLPCDRKLWHASTQSEWETEYRACKASSRSKRMLTFGDLNALRPGKGSLLTDDEMADLKDWCANVDEFGSIVLTAGLGGTVDSPLEDYRRCLSALCHTDGSHGIRE